MLGLAVLVKIAEAQSGDFAGIIHHDEGIRVDLVDDVVGLVDLLPANGTEEDGALVAAVCAAGFQLGDAALQIIHDAPGNLVVLGGDNKHHLAGAAVGAVDDRINDLRGDIDDQDSVQRAFIVVVNHSGDQYDDQVDCHDEFAQGKAADVQGQQVGSQLSAAGGTAAHQDEGKSQSCQTAAKDDGDQRVALVLRQIGDHDVDHSGGKQGGNDGFDDNLVTHFDVRPNQQGDVHQHIGGTDWDTEQMVEHRCHTGQTACGNLVGCGEGVDGHGKQKAACDEEQRVQDKVFGFFLGEHKRDTPCMIFLYAFSITQKIENFNRLSGHTCSKEGEKSKKIVSLSRKEAD